jgi:hypothetical protein
MKYRVQSKAGHIDAKQNALSMRADAFLKTRSRYCVLYEIDTTGHPTASWTMSNVKQ